MVVAAHELTRSFSGKLAVNSVSFEVGEGEFFVLVGPSGCGKTTTLRLLAGLEPADGGEVRIGGRAVTQIRPRDRDIAMVFQDYAIFPHLTVYENIAYGLRSRHVQASVIRQRTPQAATMFRIDHLLHRKPRQLSGGERQRVALARAMVRDAKAYLYDEPLSNLDAQLRHQARDDILALHQRQRKPTVYVTHDQSEAMAMGDRIAVMRGGEIQQVGTGRELYDRPASLFVAHFIGTPSINVFDVTLRSDDDGLLAVGSAFKLRLAEQVADKVRSYVDQQVHLGIRPEVLQSPRQARFAVSDETTVRGQVELIEPTTTGSTVYLTTIEDNPRDMAATFRTRLPDRYLGEQVPLAVDMTKVHVFDPASGRTLI